MKTVIATYGTTGDIQPLLALALELVRRGHEVNFAAPPNFDEKVKNFELSFTPLGPMMDQRELREIYGYASQTDDVVQQVQRTLPLVIRETPQMVEELQDACEHADVLIALPYQLAGRIVHDLTGVPLVSAHLSPFGGYGRRFASETSQLINAHRRLYGLPSLDDPLGRGGSAEMLALYAVSPHIFRRPRHWSPSCHSTGFWFLDEAYQPSKELLDFIEDGSPPVVVSFGSVLHSSPEQLSATVREAIAIANVRCVVQRGWSGLEVGSASKSIFSASYVPHDWLFSRAACVVHAGGAGTTAAALRAGVPSVVVPHVLDQFLWATLAKERGLAASVIPYGEITAEGLAEAMASAMTEQWNHISQSTSRTIRAEGGTFQAVSLIESAMQGILCSN